MVFFPKSPLLLFRKWQTKWACPFEASFRWLRYALQLKREFNNTVSSNTTVLSREGAEHFTELLDNADRIFGKKQEEFRVLASKIDIKDTSCQQSDH